MVSLVALTGNNVLVSFESDAQDMTASIAIRGLDGLLIGIDTRPADGLIYGLTNRQKIYTIDPDTGASTFVSELDTSFDAGKVSGFDFNPMADRLRLVGENKQDFRVNVDTGEVIVDGRIAYASDDPNRLRNPRVTAAAYTNAIADAETTVLYNIDTGNNTLVRQEPPDEGTLRTVGPLGVGFRAAGGFDIVSSASGENTGFAISNNTLYSINLETGAATSLGSVSFDDSADGDDAFRGLTVRASPAPTPT
ncbi:MAG: DUF4394 domain-containing protein, partial [Phormidesmis sp.]